MPNKVNPAQWRRISQAHFARVAPGYDAGRTFEQGEFWARELATRVPLGTGERLLDVGCGTGLFATSFAQALPCTIVGIDLSPAMLAAAQAKTRAIHFAQGRGEALCFVDQSFQAIFLSQVWHHLENSAQAAREFYRTLKPGGGLFIKTFSHAQLRARWDLIQVFPELLTFMLDIYPDVAELEALLSGLGFATTGHQTYSKDETLRPSALLQIATAKLWSMFAYLGDAELERGTTYLRELIAATHDAPISYPEYHCLVYALK